jgi:DivIVA domain-containing protein
VLPLFGVTGADVDAVKFTQVLRGYKTSEVDWVLDRLGRELEALRGQLAAIQASSGPKAGATESEHNAPEPEDGEDRQEIT